MTNEDIRNICREEIWEFYGGIVEPDLNKIDDKINPVKAGKENNMSKSTHNAPYRSRTPEYRKWYYWNVELPRRKGRTVYNPELREQSNSIDHRLRALETAIENAEKRDYLPESPQGLAPSEVDQRLRVLETSIENIERVVYSDYYDNNPTKEPGVITKIMNILDEHGYSLDCWDENCINGNISVEINPKND